MKKHLILLLLVIASLFGRSQVFQDRDLFYTGDTYSLSDCKYSIYTDSERDSVIFSGVDFIELGTFTDSLYMDYPIRYHEEIGYFILMPKIGCCDVNRIIFIRED